MSEYTNMRGETPAIVANYATADLRVMLRGNGPGQTEIDRVTRYIVAGIQEAVQHQTATLRARVEELENYEAAFRDLTAVCSDLSTDKDAAEARVKRLEEALVNIRDECGYPAAGMAEVAIAEGETDA